MGSAKQLLIFQGKTLLRRAIEAAVNAGCSPVVVVLGSDAGRMREEVDASIASFTINSHWEKGMGGSIRAGIEQVEHLGKADAVLITLCDQPFVDAIVIRKMVDAHRESSGSIAAASYGGSPGAPAIFPRKYFRALRELPVTGGAKQLLVSHAAAVNLIDIGAAQFDIDTPDDYQNLQGAGRE
jgi:molybdenum cofactor cytidylyltransferase